MDDKKWLENTVGNIFGGKLVELNENSYKISIRVYDEDNKAALKLKKNNILDSGTFLMLNTVYKTVSLRTLSLLMLMQISQEAIWQLYLQASSLIANMRLQRPVQTPM